MAKRGPNSAAGKGAVRMNALRSGLYSDIAVIPGESREEWEAFRSSVIAGLSVEGEEQNYRAEVIALLRWRRLRCAKREHDLYALKAAEFSTLPRVVTMRELMTMDPSHSRLVALAHRKSTADSAASALYHLQGFLASLGGLSADAEVESEIVARLGNAVQELLGPEAPVADVSEIACTAAEAREWLKTVARACDHEYEALVDGLLLAVHKQLEDARAKSSSLGNEMEAFLAVQRHPEQSELDKVYRSEAHLERQLRHEEHELEALQARRRGASTSLIRGSVTVSHEATSEGNFVDSNREAEIEADFVVCPVDEEVDPPNDHEQDARSAAKTPSFDVRKAQRALSVAAEMTRRMDAQQEASRSDGEPDESARASSDFDAEEDPGFADPLAGEGSVQPQAPVEVATDSVGSPESENREVELLAPHVETPFSSAPAIRRRRRGQRLIVISSSAQKPRHHPPSESEKRLLEATRQ